MILLAFEVLGVEDKIDFTEYDLNNATFIGVTFKECDFTGVYLSGSFFAGSVFENVC